MSGIPFILVTGFLGSGKTTLLKKLLSDYSSRKRILLIQNEFAESGIDSRELQEGGWNFSLLEMNKGSVFCVCLFADFKQVIVDQIEAQRPDMIVVETTGLADPIAIGQLINDPQVAKYTYLSNIWNVVDASSIHKVAQVKAVVNQIRIADCVVVNKCDMVQEECLGEVASYVKSINPNAEVEYTSFCDVELTKKLEAQFRLQPVAIRKNIQGELTKCNERTMVSSVYKSSSPTSRAKFEAMLGRLDDLARLKGYVRFEDGESIMVQYSSGVVQTTEMQSTITNTELIAIATEQFGFDL